MSSGHDYESLQHQSTTFAFRHDTIAWFAVVLVDSLFFHICRVGNFVLLIGFAVLFNFLVSLYENETDEWKRSGFGLGKAPSFGVGSLYSPLIYQLAAESKWGEGGGFAVGGTILFGVYPWKKRRTIKDG
jgi:hypothetical protein